MDYRIGSVDRQGMDNRPLGPCLKNVQGASGFEAALRQEITACLCESHPDRAARSCQAPSRELVHLGVISRENPTVSHLLISHPDYGGDCWKIIHSEVNAQKAFRSIREGEDIFIDPVTREVVWGRGPHFRPEKPSPERTASAGSPPPDPDAVPVRQQPAPLVTRQKAAGPGRSDAVSPARLATVLERHIGTSYERLNCYELVVAGLEEMGVRYGGPGGMQNYLINAAVSQGLPMNAYLTGNGLIEASAATVYDRTFSRVSGSRNEAEELWNEIEPCLEKGLILSFSTGERGHTGVVSRYGETWTFLNSGDMDHDVRSATRRKGVGEEDLRSEIENWIRRAGRRGKPLRIALGRLTPHKLAAFRAASSSGRTA